MFREGATAYNIYLIVQLVTLFCAIAMMFVAALHRPSRGQNVVLMFLYSAIIYLLGFTIETLATTVEGYHLACIVEYIGEIFVFMAFLYFTAYLCKLKVPIGIYIVQGLLSLFLVYMVVSTRTNHIFYRDIYIIEEGPFPHLGLTYGPGFYFTISYIALLTVVLLTMVAKFIPQANQIEKKRCACTILSILCAWLPYVLKLLGLTGGYEIPGPGMVIAGFWLLLAMEKYGFMDSLVLAGERAIESGTYAVLVFDSEFKLEYQNDQMQEILGHIEKYEKINGIPAIKKIIEGSTEAISFGDKMYDVKLEELKEGEIVQGYMIIMFDNTEHYKNVEEIHEMARRDSFTGLYNRSAYQKKLQNLIENEKPGAFVMMDVDNFKHVNDSYGHATGDEILLILADILRSFDDDEVLTCRLGGDEFSCYIQNAVVLQEVKDILADIADRFSKGLEAKGYGGYTSLSIGAVTINESSYYATNINFDRLYSYADEIMYEVKHDGKGKSFVKSFPIRR